MSPDAIIILSGGVVSYETDGKTQWRSTTYDESDAFGTLGGRDRVEAAALLAKEYPGAYLMTTSHRLGRAAPSLAQVYAEELVALGVNRERIIEEEDSDTTQTGLRAALQIAEGKGWSRLLLVSSGFHMPRIRAFFEQEHSSLAVTFVASESVLMSADPAFVARFEAIQKTPAYQKRLAAEARGVEAIRRGTYHSAPPADKEERRV